MWGFGGYVAEVIQRNNEGFWKRATNRYTFEFTRDGKITGFGVNPWAWTFKRFEEGDLLATKYKQLIKLAKQFYKASTNNEFRKRRLAATAILGCDDGAKVSYRRHWRTYWRDRVPRKDTGHVFI